MSAGSRGSGTLGRIPSDSTEPEGRATLNKRDVSFVGQAKAAFAAMRPAQWTKNTLVFLALIFAQRLTDLAAFERVAVAFLAFCFAASAVYVMNDIADRESDRMHPRKRFRPIASGQLSLHAATLVGVACVVISMGLSLWLAFVLLRGQPDPFAEWGGAATLFILTIVSYLGINVLYSLRLKHEVLWDVFIIAIGFVLRAIAGALAIPVPISPWFYLCTTFLALLLALGKRRAELLALNTSAVEHRANLRHYTLQLLDQLMGVVVTCTLITYSLYTIQGLGASHALMLTIPFVLFGIFRYLYLIYVKGEGDRPDELLWRDKQILASVILCIFTVILLLYGPLLHH